MNNPWNGRWTVQKNNGQTLKQLLDHIDRYDDDFQITHLTDENDQQWATYLLDVYERFGYLYDHKLNVSVIINYPSDVDGAVRDYSNYLFENGIVACSCGRKPCNGS